MLGRLIRQRSVGIRLTERGARFVTLESVLGRIRELDAGDIDLGDDGSPERGAASSSVEHASCRPGWQGAPGDEVILGLPRREVVCRFIDVPNVGEDQLDGLLAFEIDRHLPFSLEEACYSYRKVSSSGATARVLVMAVKRVVVEQALARVERLGIVPTGVDVVSMAATTSLMYQRGISAAETATLVQIENGDAAVDVLLHRAMVSSRIVELYDNRARGTEGGTIERESDERNTSPDAVYGMDDGSLAKGSIDAAPLVAELKRVAALHHAASGHIVVHGGEDSLRQQLQAALGVPVVRWDVTTVAADPAAFGLALRGLSQYAMPGNLLPPERRPVRTDRSLSLCRSLLAFVACLAAAWWVSDAILEQRALDRVNEDIRQVRQEASAVTALQQEAFALATRLKALEGLRAAQGRSMLLLRDVVTLLPPDVLLQELSFDGTKVRLRGSTTASAALLISAFERSVYLENAAFTAPISVQGKDRQAFEMAATVRAVPRSLTELSEGGTS